MRSRYRDWSHPGNVLPRPRGQKPYIRAAEVLMTNGAAVYIEEQPGPACSLDVSVGSPGVPDPWSARSLEPDQIKQIFKSSADVTETARPPTSRRCTGPSSDADRSTGSEQKDDDHWISTCPTWHLSTSIGVGRRHELRCEKTVSSNDLEFCPTSPIPANALDAGTTTKSRGHRRWYARWSRSSRC